MFERLMRAGAEGARRGGLLGMVGGLAVGVLGEVHHGMKVVEAVFDSDKTVREASQEYRNNFDDLMENLGSNDRNVIET